MSAIGFILMLLEFPLPMIIPPFIKFDFSELPAVITSFALGPLYGIAVCFFKNALHLFVSNSAGVGELANFILGAVFVGTAGFIYRRKKSKSGALIGTLTGSVIMAAISVASNYIIVYPFYVSFFGMPRTAIIAAYKAILPFSDTLIKSLLIFNVPFTFAKGMVVSAICFICYKKLSPILKGR